MSAKEFVRNILVQKQEKNYQKRLQENHVTYSGWIMDLEQEKAAAYKKEAKEAGTNKRQPLHIVKYNEINSALLENNLGQLPLEQLLVFVSEKGKLTVNAEEEIQRYFADHPEVELAYGDEDLENEQGVPEKPYFKPDWSPDAYGNAFYIGSIFITRLTLIRKMQSMDPALFRSSQLPMRSENGDLLFGKLALAAGGFALRDGLSFSIGHIREILFRGQPGYDLFGERHFNGEMHHLSQYVTVSIVIPSKDHPEILGQCLSSIAYNDSGDREKIGYEIIVVDNGSEAANRLKVSKKLADLPRDGGLMGTRYLYEPMPFNFSKMCNLGAKAAKGQLVLFLNDDIEIRESGWLRELVYYALQPHVGAVGAKLLYPKEDLIQHAGITKVRMGPMHKLTKMHDGEAHYFGINRGVHDMIGVTGACLLMRRDLFWKIGGFSEILAVAFNDVDLCYSLIEGGYYNVCCNHVMLIHHESLSRGDDTKDPAKLERLGKEYRTLMERHPGLKRIDPFYHPYLSDDEHVADYLRVDDSAEVKKLPDAQFKTLPSGVSGAREDPVVRIGVEYGDTIALWIHNYQLEEQGSEDGYLLKGYSFVIGSDNALYERSLLLRRAEGPTTAPVPIGSQVLLTKPVDCYREDIMKNLPDQVHVELTGFRLRIAFGTLEPGSYQIGMLYEDKTSRNKLVGWAPNLLIVEK